MNPPIDENYVFNFRLSKFIGLYQILNPCTKKYYNQNVYHIIIILLSVYIFSISILSPIGLYNLINDAIPFAFYMGTIEQFFFSIYKVLNIVYYSNVLWKCMINTNNKFMSCGLNNRNIFNYWQNYSAKMALIYIIMICFIILIWASCPLIFNKTIVTVRNLDGSYSIFKINIFNVYVPISDEVYNKYFTIFYIIEFIALILFITFSTIYDIFMIMICYTFVCQLEMINDGLKKLMHNKSSAGSISEYK